MIGANIIILPAKYIGKGLIELTEDIELEPNTKILVIIPDRDNDNQLRIQLRLSAEQVFSKLWDNEEDEVWNEFL